MHTLLTLQNRRCRGSALVYVSVIIVALMGLVSLAVDFGRVALVKSSLQAAADAAARVATNNLSAGPSTARAAAISLAGKNTAMGTAIASPPFETRTEKLSSSPSPRRRRGIRSCSFKSR